MRHDFGRHHTNVPRFRRPAFTLTEMLVVVGIIAVLASVLVAAYGAVCDTADTALCAGQLKNLGTLLAAYAGGNDGWLPDTGAASTKAGPVPSDGYHFSDRWDAPGSACWPQSRSTGNAGNLYLLIKVGLAQADQFVCPASGDRAAFGPFTAERFSFLAYEKGSTALSAQEKEYLAKHPTRHCSYSYQNMLGHPANDPKIADPAAAGVHVETSPADLVVLADHNPYTQLKGENRECLDPDAAPLANSLNHAGRGQNVLTLDGRVAWFDTPLAGAELPAGSRDNIYRPASGKVTDAENIPRHDRDSYLVP